MTAVLTPTPQVTPDRVRAVLARSILTDGFDLVLDLDRQTKSVHPINQLHDRRVAAAEMFPAMQARVLRFGEAVDAPA